MDHMKALTVWFTGLPGSGKTTLGDLLVSKWRIQGYAAEILDGDSIRNLLGGTVGFSKEERRRHVLSSAFTASLLSKNGIHVAAAFVSPYQSIRQEAKKIIGTSFIEVFVDCPVSICMERDPKGLYKKAKSGGMKGLTGIDDVYEPPEKPDLVLKTGTESIEESLGRILTLLRKRDL